MRDDGQYGGTKYIVPIGTVARWKAICTNHQFTLLPFVALTGEPVVYSIIFNSASDAVNASWNSGFDITAEIYVNAKGEPVIDERNCKEGGFYLEGLTCNFMEKRFQCSHLSTAAAASTLRS